MRILLAGGGGFVGSHLACRLLAGGHRIVVVDDFSSGRRENLRGLEHGQDSSRIEVVECDVCRLPDLAGPFDAVLHLASPASPVDYLRRPLETLAVGSTGTQQLLDFAGMHRARFLLASTSEVYGDPQVHPQPECYWGNVNPVGPRSVYDEAKRFAEALSMAHARHRGTVVRIARIFNTYGPGMRLDDGRVIPSFVSQALGGEALTVNGDGLQTRSYCYVDDLVDGLIALLESDAEGPVNLGNPEEFTVLDTARMVLLLTGRSSEIVHRAMPEDDPRLRRPDIRRAQDVLGWRPRTSFRDGLRRTVDDIAARILAGETGSPPPLPISRTDLSRNGRPTPIALFASRVPGSSRRSEGSTGLEGGGSGLC